MNKELMHINMNNTKFGFDITADVSFLSHGHKDHVQLIRKNTSVIATEPTFDLAFKSFKKVDPKDIDESIKLHDAGHILGSSQISIDYDGNRILYTGDLNARGNIFSKGAEIPEADIVIMDGTYNDPNFVFPNYFDIVENIGKWIINNDAKIRIIGGYPIGKTQELIKIINDYGHETPLIDSNAEKYTRVYEKYGVKLDYVVVGTDEAEELMKHPFIAIVPPKKANIYFAGRLSRAFNMPAVSAVATGWALKYKYNTHASFPLSDHSDYNQIWSFIEGTGAKDVRFFCGPRNG